MTRNGEGKLGDFTTDIEMFQEFSSRQNKPRPMPVVALSSGLKPGLVRLNQSL
jgi:hypothetical protein